MVVTKGLLSHSASPFSHRRTFFCCLGACVFWTVEKYVGPYQYFSLSRNREAEHRSIPVLVPRRSYVGPTGNSETLLLVPVVLLPVPGSTHPTGTYFRNKTARVPVDLFELQHAARPKKKRRVRPTLLTESLCTSSNPETTLPVTIVLFRKLRLS
jgi:hypothetical protein